MPLSGVRHARYIPKMIDEEVYLTKVLCLPPDLTEDELDHRLELEARVLGLQCRSPSVDRLTSSISTTTSASGSQKPSSAISRSTDPTSCSSSVRRHTPESPRIRTQPNSPPRPVTSPLDSFTDRKALSFRNGFRKMSVFRKRRSEMTSAAVTPANLNQGSEDAGAADGDLAKKGLESPASISSRQSGWSASVPPMTSMSVEESAVEDKDDKHSTRPTKQGVELLELQGQQQAERDRFLEYQRKCLNELRTEYENSKKQKIETQAAVVREKRERNDQSIADLEFRQLEAEMRLMEDLEAEKRTCVIRLRHMEAYCHSPSPRPTSASDSSSPKSPSARPDLPYRKVTDKDFHNLAQQYRERDAMENLHRSKIEVLWGRQEKQYSDYVARKTREINQMKAEHGEEIEKDDLDARAEEQGLTLALAERRDRLERRWRLQLMIERAKQDKKMMKMA